MASRERLLTPRFLLVVASGLSYFMALDSCEQVVVEDDRLGPSAAFLEAGAILPVEFFEGEPIGVEVPDIVDATVAETAPPFHGTDNVWKPARLENGVTIQVPPFIARGERVRVDVHAGRYVERARLVKTRHA